MREQRAYSNRLIHQWTGLDDICRGRTDRYGIETERACKRRDQIGPLLDRVDWCYGHNDGPESDKMWHKCDANSNRYEE
ncbi:hypothetical protein ACVINI_002442 [Rhizobium beringeri]